MRPVFFAGEDAHEGAALAGGVLANGAAEHGTAGFEGVEDAADGDGRGDFEGDFRRGVGERAQVLGEDDADGQRGFDCGIGHGASVG